MSLEENLKKFVELMNDENCGLSKEERELASKYSEMVDALANTAKSVANDNDDFLRILRFFCGALCHRYFHALAKSTSIYQYVEKTNELMELIHVAAIVDGPKPSQSE